MSAHLNPMRPPRKVLKSGPRNWSSKKRRLRRELMAQHVAETGKPNSGRQWNRLKRRLRREERGVK